LEFFNFLFPRKFFLKSKNLPKHIAIIMDGNGRWAKKRLLPREAGHVRGVNVVKDVINLAKKYNINSLTLFAFSTENWTRPKNEVLSLLNLFDKSIDNEKDKIESNNIKMKFIGDLSSLPSDLQKKIIFIEKKCEKNNGMQLNIAISYGGRSEIVRAVNKFIKNKKTKQNISETLLSKNLDTHGLPEIDLLIRTGGEKRLSNFMLWQLAYSELFFTDALWPDFNEPIFIKALYFFQTRKRRFGSLMDI